MGSSRTKPFTVKEIERLTAERPRTIRHYALGGVPGFVLVATPQGYTGYAVIYRYRGKRKKLTLGSTQMLKLAEARALAGKHRDEVAAGRDPHAEKVLARHPPPSLECEHMWEKYLTLAASKLRSRPEKERIFKRYMKPVLAGLQVGDIKRAHALEIIDPLVAEGKHRMADKVRQEGAAWFQWLLEREQVERNPFAGLRKAEMKKVIRTRVLSDEELKQIWIASEPEGRWSLWFKLMILTGTRNMEARAASWSEFDFDNAIWTIPAERSKNKVEQRIHLTATTRAILDKIPRFDGVGDLVFPASLRPTKGKAKDSEIRNPMSGDQKVKDRIDARMRQAIKQASGTEPANWQIHDFRRTVGTGLQRMGFRPEIADQVLGHVSTTRSGAGAHYLHHKYEEEKRGALEAWSSHVMEITGELSRKPSEDPK